jgi:hypothetical protein
MADIDQLRKEAEALRDADTLHMLPKEALIASIKALAEEVLDLTDPARLAQLDLASHPRYREDNDYAGPEEFAEELGEEG